MDMSTDEVGRTVSSPYVKKQQLRHFLLFDVLPHMGLIGAILCLWVLPFGWPEALSFVLMWAVTGVGVTVGYHRLFTHRSFSGGPTFETGLAIAGSMAGQGGVISWACLHRRHHQTSDREGDPHSPNLHGPRVVDRILGISHSHFFWMREHDYPNPGHYVKDLLKEKHVVWANKRYYWWVVLGFVLPGVFVALMRQDVVGLATGVLWGGAVRMVVVGHTIWAINSLLHVTGRQTHQTTDNSRNAPLFGLVTFGEAFHNSHHAHPRSALFGIGAPLLDPGYWFIWLSEKLGFVTNVHVPNSEVVSKRLRSNQLESN